MRGSNDAILNKLLECPYIRVDVENNDSNSPLHYFCERNHSPDCERIGQQLIDKGAIVNKTNNNGETVNGFLLESTFVQFFFIFLHKTNLFLALVCLAIA